MSRHVPRACPMRSADVGDGGDDLSSQPRSVADIVRGDVVRLFPKERCLPLAELVAVKLGVVDHEAVERPVELLGVDSVPTLDKPHTPKNPTKTPARGPTTSTTV